MALMFRWLLVRLRPVPVPDGSPEVESSIIAACLGRFIPVEKSEIGMSVVEIVEIGGG